MEEFEKDLQTLENSVRSHTEGYKHSTTVLAYTVTTDDGKGGGKTYDVQLDLRDMLLLSAIAGANVILSGKTGGGKTTFSKGVVNSLFGEHFGFLQIDTELDENKFRDMMFDVIKSGGKLSEAAEPKNTITAPAVVIDEYNRAPPLLTNKLQGYIEAGTMTLDGGKELEPGVELQDGSRYQWKIATINEGSAYSGVSSIDKAGRDRFALEIPLDAFPPTNEDRRARKQAGGRYNYARSRSTVDLRDTVFRLHDKIASVTYVPMDPLVQEFGIYLMNKDNCHRSPEGTKLMFDDFTTQICQGARGDGMCPAYNQFEHVCGEVGAPSDRVDTHMDEFAKALALYRKYKHPETELRVTLSDYMAAVQFAMYHKLDISPGWTSDYAAGSSWEATKVALNQILSRFISSQKISEPIRRKEERGEALTEDDRRELQNLLMRDPSAGTIAQMREIYRSQQDGTQIQFAPRCPLEVPKAQSVQIAPSKAAAVAARVKVH